MKKPTLIQEIAKERNQFLKIINNIPVSKRNLKIFKGTGGNVSITDLISYQIGWGKFVIRWYENGIKGEQVEMPGDGFSKWDYVAIAQYFYQKYQYDCSEQQIEAFNQIVTKILEIVEKEQTAGQLEELGVWNWCTLASGKKWPLSKWIRINTVSPYKRAVQIIKKHYRDPHL